MKKQFVLAALLAAAPFAATAGNLNYTFVEGGYVRTNIDSIGDGDGVAVAGSAAVGSMFHVFGAYSKQEADESAVNVDLDQFRVGFGVNYSLTDNADLLARVAYEYSDLDSGTRALIADAKADGYSVEAGVRAAFGTRLEGWALGGYGRVEDAKINNVNVDIDDGDFYGRVGVLAKLNPTWGVVAEGTFNDDSQTVFAGLRASF